MKHLLLLQYTSFRNTLLRLTLLDEIKIAAFMVAGLFFWLTVYLGALRLLTYLNGVAVVGTLLMNKLVSLLFLTSFVMVVFSSLITSFSTIFSSRDLQWLMATPLSVRQIFTFKAVSTTLYSSWMVLVALYPFLLALGTVKHLPVSFYVVVTAALIPFLIIASVTGILISLALMRFFPVHRIRDSLLLVSVLFMTGVYVLLRFMQPERLVKPDGMEIVAQYLTYLDAPTAVYLPSWWVSGAVFGCMRGAFSDVLFYGVLLLGGACIALISAAALAQRFFYVGWAEGQVYHRRAHPAPMVFTRRSVLFSLLEKDVKIFFRDTGQWSQLLFLGALTLVYLFSIYKLPLDTMYLQNLVAFLNVGLIGFILAAVALRFVFPAVSLEAESLWLLRASPVTLRRFLAGKLIFGSLPVMLLALLLILASNLLLKTDGPVFWMSVVSTLVMTAGLSCMAVGLGAVFPRFRASSVSQIESSPGGLFYMVSALFYLGVTISLWAMPVHNFYRQKFGGSYVPWPQLWWIALALLIVNAAVILIPLHWGLKSLENKEEEV